MTRTRALQAHRTSKDTHTCQRTSKDTHTCADRHGLASPLRQTLRDLRCSNTNIQTLRLWRVVSARSDPKPG